MDLRAIAMGLAFALIWSSAFTSARIIVAAAPPLTALAVRFALSGLIALALARMAGQALRLDRRQWVLTILFGICQNAIYLGLNFVAMQSVEASLAAIIASTMPLLVAAIGWIVFRNALSPLAIAGLVAGTAGAALIMGTRISVGGDLFGISLCAIAALALAVATLALRGASSGGNVMAVVGLQMLVGAAVLTPFAAALETPSVDWSPALVAAFAYTTVFPGLVATWIWFRLVNRIGAVRAATFHFLNPFFGVAIAALLLGEAVGVADIVGVVVIAAGILAVQLAAARTAPAGAA